MVVNLNQYRKKRRVPKRTAVRRITRFGRSKEQRGRDLRESERSKKEIDGKRLD